MLNAKILAPNDKVLAQGSVSLQASSKAQRVQVPLDWFPTSGLEDAATARLVYELQIAGNLEPLQKGILSPYALIPDLFELRFLGLQTFNLGQSYVARVWATRPDSNKPVPGVELTATLGDPDEEDTQAKALRTHSRTNSRGEALLTFHVPLAPGVPTDEEISLEVKGVLHGFQNSVTADLRIWNRAAVLLSTDKPLYQPGQPLHMRALLLDNQRHAWAKRAVRFVVRDPDDSIVFSTDTETSRFGIASADWHIPSTQKTGNYRVSAEITGDGDSREFMSAQMVRITHYELPTFTVNVVPNQPYYLPGQNSDLVVNATYMFGKPVLRGHVRIVRESSRTWNYREQKWNTDEIVAAEGDLDAKNEFHATLSLTKDHADLHDSDWERFKDLRFAAFLTDASSARTQERRFDLRISRDAVHLYLLPTYSSLPLGLPPVFFLSASLADGTPASADVAVNLFSEDPSEATPPAAQLKAFATAHVRTNRYGIALVRIPGALTKGKDQERVYIVLEARTLDGRTGSQMQSYSLDDGPNLRLTPAKPVLGPGDAIEVTVEASAPHTRARVEVISDDTHTILASQEMTASPSPSHVTFAPDPRFTGVVTVAVYPLDAKIERYSRDEHTAAASVVFPKPTTLQLNVKPVKATYRPGEGATVNLSVRTPQGEPTSGALGLLVYDQALEELARTEAGVSTNRWENIDPRLGFHLLDADDDSGISGVSLKRLLNLTPGESVSADLELAAEALLFARGPMSFVQEDSDYPRNLEQTFRTQINRDLSSTVDMLQAHFTTSGHFPADDAEYIHILRQAASNAVLPVDPWGRPYHVERSYQWTNEVLQFRSDGPHKTPHTSDDFAAKTLSRPFFERDGLRLRSILDAYHTRTGGYVRDLDTLATACREAHTSLDTFIDPWGTPYRFAVGVARDTYTVAVTSAGPDKRFASNRGDDYDDLTVSVLSTPYFRELTQQISDALNDSAKKSARFPENEQDFRDVMRRYDIDFSALRDPWDRPYRVGFAMESSYADKITLRVYGQATAPSQTPVTHTVKVLTIVSDGPDLAPNTADDFVVARFVSPFLEEPGTLATPAKPQKPEPVFSGNSGALRVTIKDATGAVIPNAKATLTSDASGVTYTDAANQEGVAFLANLPPGTYHILVESPGFQVYAMTGIPVLSSNVTNLEVTLNVGTTMQTVEVTAASFQLQTESAEFVEKFWARPGSAKVNVSVATPRLREYFRETLLWQPEVLTDRSGRTTVKIPLADSITTWRVSVIASTLDGGIATASTDIHAFQPFFAELDPPKVLTVGDEIHLPVIVRNYLDKPQSVSLDWAAEPWMQTLSSPTARFDVPAGDYARQSFAFRAALPLKNAKQRVTAYNRSSQSNSDAIEKKLRIHADGQERVLQANSMFIGDTTLNFEIPANAMPGSIEAELILYPSLIAHVADSIEGIMARPYGCAEQTISSAYPSLLWLQLKKSHHFPASPLNARAERYLHLAYAKLLRYREPGGGFSLWGKGRPEVDVTAYALRFLTEASDFLDVDPEVIASTRHWLQQATPQGAWAEKDANGKVNEFWTLEETAYVVEILARDLQHSGTMDKAEKESEQQAVRKALDFLSPRLGTSSDPYDIALLTLAKLSTGSDDASKEIAALLATAHAEGEMSFWDLQRNTIFYGWGYAGRIETTALVLDALASYKQQGHGGPEYDRVLTRGTNFLLKVKDRYGVWFTTQATVDALTALIRQLQPESPAETRNTPLRILVDGKLGPELSASSDARNITPRRADLTPFLSPGSHRIEIHGGPSVNASAYLNAIYYLPWTAPSVTRASVRSGDAEALRYSVNFDRLAAATADSIRCTVHAERVGFRGYGMMLAEIGLRPGTDVDRASLDAALSGDLDVQSYEVQPDRVVVYLWPKAGGTTFSFTLKPRFAMTAQSAESILYDYYNPEARASVPPTRFVIHGVP